MSVGSSLSLVDSLLTSLESTVKETATPTDSSLVDSPVDIGVVDLSPLIDESDESESAVAQRASVAKQISESLEQYGVVVVKDPRVPFEKNAQFIDLFEDYFNRPLDEKLKDTRPETGFQVGPTPDHKEKPRERCAMIETLDPHHRPLTPCPPEADPKWRYFWRLGSEGKGKQGRMEGSEETKEGGATEKESDFAVLNMANVVPDGMPDFKKLCNDWGDSLLNAGRSIARGLEINYGMPDGFITKRMDNAAHLLAPTATDLNKYGSKGTVIAGYHYDLNFLTVHGKSRYPGLYVWLRDGRRRRVVVPDGCLIAQAALQMEHMFGGHIWAGFHEVVVTDATIKAMETQRKNKRPLWRISSTVFTHLRSDVLIEPFGVFATDEAKEKYSQWMCGDLVIRELKAIGLMKDED